MIATSSVAAPIPDRWIRIEDATDKELRQLLNWPNTDITRAQLLAACKNRDIVGFVRA
jgi:hypothetical protein